MRFSSIGGAVAAAAIVTVALAQDAAKPDPVAAAMAMHDKRVEGYLSEFTKRVVLARDRFDKSAGASAGLTIKSLEDTAARAIRAGDLKAAGAAYFQVLRLDDSHAKARGHFEAIGQLDATMARVKADPFPIRAPAGGGGTGGGGGDASAAWKQVLKMDRDNAEARKYFEKRGELRKVLAEVVPAPPKDAVQFNGHYYKVYSHELGLIGFEAAAKCRELGGHLARIESAQENDAVAKVMLKAGIRWAMIDGSDRANEGVWRFGDSRQMRYLAWAGDQPKRGEHDGNQRLQLRAERVDWHTLPDGQRTAFVCEWPSREEQLK